MLKLNFNPNQKHLTEIENWLMDEWNKTNSGFYYDWDSISTAFVENNLCVITENDYAIGFAVFRIYELISVIDLTEVKPSERKKGVAKKLIDETLVYFKQKGVLVTELYYSPKNTESFWRKMGFENFPQMPQDTKLNMFKPLVETLQATEKAKTHTTISLWDCEPYQAEGMKAKWIWDLTFKTDNETLEKPIIFPVSNNWQIALAKHGQNIITNKVKKFRLNIASCSSFIILEKISVQKV